MYWCCQMHLGYRRAMTDKVHSHTYHIYCFCHHDTGTGKFANWFQWNLGKTFPKPVSLSLSLIFNFPPRISMLIFNWQWKCGHSLIALARTYCTQISHANETNTNLMLTLTSGVPVGSLLSCCAFIFWFVFFTFSIWIVFVHPSLIWMAAAAVT